MTSPHVLAGARAAHERLMTDTCTIEAVTTGPLDNATSRYTETTTTLYSGKCRVKLAPVTLPETGERQKILTRPTLKLPASSTAIPPRARVTVTASSNPALVGRVFTILGEESGSHSTARNFVLED